MARIDWVDRLQALQGQAGAIPVYLCHENKRIDGVVHVIPLPPEQATEARRRVRQRALKKGRQASATSLFLSGWVLIFTSLPVTLLDTATIAALYRLRWQVELSIKRLKSVLDIDRLRAGKGSPLAELYLYGKLLYAAVIEKLVARRFGRTQRRLDSAQTHTPWRLWQLALKAFCSALIACFPPQPEYLKDSLKSLCERPRKRKLQALPKPVLELLEFCRSIGVSAV